MGVMGGTLLVSGSDKGREFLLQLLKEEDCQPVTPAASGDEARRLITQCDFDLILINAPAAGEKGPSLAVFAVENTTAAVLLLVKAEAADETAAQVEDLLSQLRRERDRTAERAAELERERERLLAGM